MLRIMGIVMGRWDIHTPNKNPFGKDLDTLMVEEADRLVAYLAFSWTSAV